MRPIKDALNHPFIYIGLFVGLFVGAGGLAIGLLIMDNLR